MIVLLHGFLGGPSAWRSVGLTNARTLTLPGHHDEPVVPNFQAAVEWLTERLDTPSHVVGYSMGARIALATASAHPERIERLTLIGGGVGLEGDATARVTWEREIASLLREDFDHFLDRWTALPLFASQRRLPIDTLAEQERLRRSHDPTRVAQTFENLALSRMPNLWPRLGALSMPIRFVAGAEDTKYVQIAQRAAATAPDAIATIVLNAGHNVVLERPDAVRAFVSPSQAS